MRKNRIKNDAIWVLATEVVGGISSWLTREGTEIFKYAVSKPPLTPPGIVFPIVWTVIYALMGIGGSRIYMATFSRFRTHSLVIYFVQLGFNFFWSLIFFNLRFYGFSFFWLMALWLLIIAMIRAFRQVNPAAARLQIPYLLWVTFAVYLNGGVWVLN